MVFANQENAFVTQTMKEYSAKAKNVTQTVQETEIAIMEFVHAKKDSKEVIVNQRNVRTIAVEKEPATMECANVKLLSLELIVLKNFAQILVRITELVILLLGSVLVRLVGQLWIVLRNFARTIVLEMENVSKEFVNAI